MSSLMFLFAIVGFLVVAHWAYVNDSERPNKGDKGLLRMKSTPADTPVLKGASPRWWSEAAKSPGPVRRGFNRAAKTSEARWQRKVR